MKGYKAFRNGMTCRGKQYKENETFQEKGNTKCCMPGLMHFCKEPLAIFRYYEPFDLLSYKPIDIAEVEALGEVHNEADKFATNILYVESKMSLDDIIKAEEEYQSQLKNGIEAYPNICIATHTYQCVNATSITDILASRHIGSELFSAERNPVTVLSTGYDSYIRVFGAGSKIMSTADNCKIYTDGSFQRILALGRGNSITVNNGHKSTVSAGENSLIQINGNMFYGNYVEIRAGEGSSVVTTTWTLDRKTSIRIPLAKVAHVGTDLTPDVWYVVDNGSFSECDDINCRYGGMELR